jgi:hypothetical protein
MEHTAKHFALQLGAFITLYVSLTSLIVLTFSVINLLIPDASYGVWETESSMSTVRFSIATLVVFFPTYLALTRIVNNQRRDGSALYLGLTKWLLYLSLLAGGLLLLGNFVTTIYTFLNGELTLRFILKAGTLFVVVGGAFTYYLYDARGYWQKNEQKSIYVGMAVSLVVLTSIVTGFMQIQKPSEVREARIDDTQIQDLSNIQMRIEEKIDLRGNIPTTLEEVFGEFPILEAPEGRPAYEYKVTENGFELCATFALASNPDEFAPSTSFIDEKTLIRNPYNWEHPAGRYCFERMVNITALPLRSPTE